MSAYEITVLGLVQGVGYRAFVTEYAREKGYLGYVRNFGGAVRIYVDCPSEEIGGFAYHLRYNCPKGARIESIKVKPVKREEEERPVIEKEKGDTLDELRKKYGVLQEEEVLTASQQKEVVTVKKNDSEDDLYGVIDDVDENDSSGDSDNKPLEGTVEGFRVVRSEEYNEGERFIPMDIAICPECRKELLDPSNRRYRYPFISCKYCGPRYSIITAIPYNRHNTTMSTHKMCPECRNDFLEAGGRRQIADTICCSECGPRLRLYKNRRVDEIQLSSDEIISEVARAIKDGQIGAIKGVGGFHFAFSPMESEAALKIRKFKGGVRYPFAVMFPDVESIRRYCEISAYEEEILNSNARPIVLLKKKKEYMDAEAHRNDIILGKIESDYKANEIFAYEVCGDSCYMGAMLPSTALQILLSMETGPIAFTSGNKTGEPIIPVDDDMIGFLHEVDESEMKGIEISSDPSRVQKLVQIEAEEDSLKGAIPPEERGIIKEESETKEKKIHLDFMLTNTLDIVMPMDDSVVQVVRMNMGFKKKEILQYIRRSKGYVPVPIRLEMDVNGEAFSAGGDTMTNYGLARKNLVYMSEYFGDLSNRKSVIARRDSLAHMERLFGIRPQKVYIDLHPDYQSSKEGMTKVRETNSYERRVELVRRQHHTSHVLSVAAENGLRGRLLGVSFDGNGHGLDGTIWGSEIFSCLLNTIGAESNLDSEKTVELKPYIQRSGAFLPIKMIDGDAKTILCCFLKAAEDRQLMSLGGLDRILRSLGIARGDYAIICACLRADINIFYSSSVGNLFEAASALLDIRTEESYDGECAAMLENYATRELDRLGVNIMSLTPLEDRSIFGDNPPVELKITEPRDEEEIFRMDQTLLMADMLESYVSLTEQVTDKAELKRGKERLALELHKALIDATVEVCDQVCSRDYIQHIALSGGAMTNHILLDGIAGSLEKLGYTTYLNKDVPPGDGGIALGQMYQVETM